MIGSGDGVRIEVSLMIGSDGGVRIEVSLIHVQTHTCIISFYLFTNEIY
jgi:hypothetical protein